MAGCAAPEMRAQFDVLVLGLHWQRIGEASVNRAL
jgi:hypothetical protein